MPRSASSLTMLQYVDESNLVTRLVAAELTRQTFSER